MIKPTEKFILLTGDCSIRDFEKHLDLQEYKVLDRPEQGLHPKFHRNIANSIIKCIHLGDKIALFTYSDFLMNEMNLFVTINQINDEEFLKKWGYSKELSLKVEDIAGYELIDNEFRELEKSEYGILVTSINKLLIDMTERIYAIQEKSEEV